MSKTTFVDYICRPYCLYFKAEKENIACRGAEVLEELKSKGFFCPKKLPIITKNPLFWEEYRSPLTNFLCKQCSFRLEDCDFQSRNPIPGTEPCGGYILISHLLAMNLLDLDFFSP